MAKSARRQPLNKGKIKKPRITRNESYLMNLKYLGDEPDTMENPTSSQYIQALNWYNYMATLDEQKEWLQTYLKQNNRDLEAKRLRSVNDTWFPTTAAHIARMLSRGWILDKDKIDFIDKSLNLSINKKQEEKKQEVIEKQKSSIKDYVKEKRSEIIGEIEGLIDDGNKFSLYDWLKANEVAAMHVQFIIEYYKPILVELCEAHVGKDPQLKEGYSHLKKKKLEELIKFYHALIADAERYGDVTKKVRKPRKPRPVSVEKKLKTFKYQKEDANFKIASVNPEKLIGCQELWTFNTKYKMITVLRAADRGGLDVKGTSIINYDEKTSVTKRTGRKPEVFVKKVMETGKIGLRKIMDEMKVAAPLSYRINENTILLRIVN